MSEADEFRRYAEEALLWARQSTTESEREKRALLELARTWGHAAIECERTVVVNDRPTEHRGL